MLITLLFIAGCVSQPRVGITGLEDAQFVKQVNMIDYTYGLYQSDLENESVRVKIFSLQPEEFENYINSFERDMLNVYKNSTAPYPGAVTHSMQCPDYYIPERVELQDKALLSYNVFINSRRALGACSNDTIQYYCRITFVACNKLYEVEDCYQSSGEKYEFKNYAQCD